MRRRNWLAALAAAGTAALAAGCAAPRVATPAARSGHYTGRLAIFREAAPGAENSAGESWSAGFELEGSADAGELRLYTPVGTTVAQVRWTPAGAALTDGSGNTRGYDTLDALTLAYFREVIPVAALFDWLAGEPTTHAALGWHADLSRAAEGRISAERRTPAPPVRLRVVLEAT